MSERPFRLELLGKQPRSGFDCGVPELNAYLQKQASQDAKRRYATCFVAVEYATGQVVGYYTLAMSSINLGELPPELVKKLPRYPQVPVARLGRLAVDLRCQGQALGASLVADAIVRTAHAEVASYALVVDAKDAQAAAYYERFGFVRLTSSPRTLFLPLTEAIKKLGR
jgi:predicted GNAT family N-acyltransferase